MSKKIRIKLSPEVVQWFELNTNLERRQRLGIDTSRDDYWIGAPKAWEQVIEELTSYADGETGEPDPGLRSRFRAMVRRIRQALTRREEAA